MNSVSATAAALLGLVFLAGAACADPVPVPASEPWSPRRMLVGPYGLPDEAFLSFVEQVRPEMVVVGSLGAPQWAAQADPGQWIADWKTVCERLHRADVKVVGMIELLTVADSPQQYEVFREFYEKRWPEALLGKRPTETARDLLELREDPITAQIGYRAPRGCASNPHWRALMKSFLKPLVAAGFDGFVTHRNMYGECGCPFCDSGMPAQGAQGHNHHGAANLDSTCPHCRRGFRHWLAEHYNRSALKDQFGIDDVTSHQFPTLLGNFREHERQPSPLELEMLRFSKELVKDAFDDIFVRHGRTLNPKLIAAQWNHMPYFDELHRDRTHIPPSERTTFAHAAADERWGLPIELWGRGESFFWYCNWGTTQNSQLEQQFVGDATITAKLLRSLARGRPYVVNKYDYYRPRNMLAEAAALGMMAGAIDVPRGTDEDRATMARYFGFLARHAALYQNGNGQSIADALLVYPRTATHAGRAGGLERVEIAARTLIVDHVAFDLIPDDLLPQTPLDPYRTVILVEPPPAQSAAWDAFQKRGGKIVALVDQPGDFSDTWRLGPVRVVAGLPIHSGGKAAAGPLREAIAAAMGTPSAAAEAPWTVETHVYRQPDKLVAHLVNYDHDEQATGPSAVVREAPRRAAPVKLRLPLRADERIARTYFLDPDRDAPVEMNGEPVGDSFIITTPDFLVYGVVVAESEPRSR